MSAGDALARGARSAVFPPPKVSAEKWAQIWDEPEKEKPTKKKQPKLKTVWSKG